jgi:transposase
MLVIWSLNCGLTCEDATRVAGVAHSTVERDVRRFRSGRLKWLRTSGVAYQPTSDLAQYADIIRQSLEAESVRSMTEVCHRIEVLTGGKRDQTQVRTFLKSIALELKVPASRYHISERRFPQAIPDVVVWPGED